MSEDPMEPNPFIYNIKRQQYQTGKKVLKIKFMDGIKRYCNKLCLYIHKMKDWDKIEEKYGEITLEELQELCHFVSEGWIKSDSIQIQDLQEDILNTIIGQYPKFDLKCKECKRRLSPSDDFDVLCWKCLERIDREDDPNWQELKSRLKENGSIETVKTIRKQIQTIMDKVGACGACRQFVLWFDKKYKSVLK
jgi:hypothetical protein